MRIIGLLIAGALCALTVSTRTTIAAPYSVAERTIVSQVHNAPGWEPSHSYRYRRGPFTRVVNGPGWDPTSATYRPGQPLAAYQLVSREPCISASTTGPLGTGSSIQDGTCRWKYLSRVDYVSITGWAFDNQPWRRGTLYHYRDHVTAGAPLRAYALEDNACPSTTAPGGTGNARTALLVTEDGCHWKYLADVLYSSERSYIPTETFANRQSAARLALHANYQAELWNDREYVAGQNGESAPIRLQMHNDYRHEGGVVLGCRHSACPRLILTTAPGESFRDGTTPEDPLPGYDPARGVAIRNSLPYRYPYEPAGLDVHDNDVVLAGLQIKSVHGAAVNGLSSFGNVMTILDCILEGGSDDRWTSHAAVTTDTSSVIANSLIIAHGPIGVVLKYPGFVVHSTIVAATPHADSVGIETSLRWVFHGTIVSNTAVFGFAHAAAHGWGPSPWSALSSHDMTDAPKGDDGTTSNPYEARTPATVDVLSGTTYGVSHSGIFVHPGSDWRTTPASPLRGAGNALRDFAVGCPAAHPDCPRRRVSNADSPDIIATPRPQAGDYDIGAWQSCGPVGCSGRQPKATNE